MTRVPRVGLGRSCKLQDARARRRCLAPVPKGVLAPDCTAIVRVSPTMDSRDPNRRSRWRLAIQWSGLGRSHGKSVDSDPIDHCGSACPGACSRRATSPAPPPARLPPPRSDARCARSSAAPGPARPDSRSCQPARTRVDTAGPEVSPRRRVHAAREYPIAIDGRHSGAPAELYSAPVLRLVGQKGSGRRERSRVPNSSQRQGRKCRDEKSDL